MYQNSYSGMMPSQMGSQYGYGGDGVLGSAPGYSHQAPPYPVQSQQLQAQHLQAQQLQAQQLQQQQLQQQQQYQQQHLLQQQQSSSQQMPWGKSGSSAVNHEPEPDPEMYETSVYLGIDDDSYDYRTKVIGEKGENLDYVRKSTGAKVLLRGKGSGVYNTRPPHIFISHSTLSGMEDAEKLAYNLIKSVKEDYQEWKSKGGSRESQQVHNYSQGDRGQQQNLAIVKDYGHSNSNSNRQSQYDDSSRYSGGYSQDSSSRQRQGYDNGSSRNIGMQQQQQQGGRGDGDRYGRSSQSDQRGNMQGGGSRLAGNMPGSNMPGTLYCDVCNIHCPNRDMYERHLAGVMHLETVRQNQKKQGGGGGIRHMDSRGQQQQQPADLGGTHWEGPPEPLNPHQEQWQDLDTGVTLEDYIFTQCEKVLKTMISDISLRNLKRSVEKIGQRDLKSAIPTAPQSNTYCKLCKESVPNMPQHLTVKSHGNMYLLRQIQLGELFMDYYSDVPIPGVITNGGRVLAMDTLGFGPYIPETNRERFKELLVYSGAYLAYKCSICTANITCLGDWVQHTTSKRHGRAVIDNILQYGIEAFVAKNPHIPVPPPRNALEILSGIDNIINLHPTIPRRRSTQLTSPGGNKGQTSSGYQQLASLSAQERQLVLQVQALTGIDDLTLVINVLTALGGMDPGMLQTLSALDPLAIQHAVSGNVALQGMDVKFVQKVIKMYLNYKGIPLLTQQQSQQPTYRQQHQVVQLQQMYQQQRANQAQANWVSGVGVMRGTQRTPERRTGSRWDDGNSGRGNDRGSRDRNRDRGRGTNDRKDSKGRTDNKSPGKADKGRTDNRSRNDKGKADSKDKKPDSKTVKSNTDNKTDKAKTDTKSDKAKTENKTDKAKTDNKTDKTKTDNKTDKAKTDNKTDKAKTDDKTDKAKTDDKTDKAKTDDKTDKAKTDDKTDKAKTDDKTDKAKTDDKTDKAKTDDKTDKAKTDDKTDKAKTDNKKDKSDSKKDNKADSTASDKTKTDASKETSGKRPGDKVTEPPAKKAVLIDLTDDDVAEKTGEEEKGDSKKTEEKDQEKKDASEAKEKKEEETEEEVKEEMETDSKGDAEKTTEKDKGKSEGEDVKEDIVEIKDDSEDADEKKEETTKEEKPEEEKPEDGTKSKVAETSEVKETPSSSQEDDDIKEVAISEKEPVGKSPRGRGGRARRSRRGRGAAAGGRKTRASLRGVKDEADGLDKSSEEPKKTVEEPEKTEELKEPEKKEENAEDLNKSPNESISLENFQTVDEYVADEEPEKKKVCKEGDIKKNDDVEKTDDKKEEEKEAVDTTKEAAEETSVQAAEEVAEEGIDVDMDDGAEGDADCTEEIDEDKLLQDDDEEMKEDEAKA